MPLAGYHLRILRFLCKRQNKLLEKENRNLRSLAIGTSPKNWDSLLEEINATRNKPIKATSLERCLRELKREGFIKPLQEDSSHYIVSGEGFEAIGIEEKKWEEKKEILLPSKDKIHTNIRCRNCHIVDGYQLEENTCRYCGSTLFSMDRI